MKLLPLFASIANAFGMPTAATIPPTATMLRQERLYRRSTGTTTGTRQTRPPWRIGRIRRTGIKRTDLIGRRLGVPSGVMKYNFDGTLNPLWK